MVVHSTVCIKPMTSNHLETINPCGYAGMEMAKISQWKPEAIINNIAPRLLENILGYKFTLNILPLNSILWLNLHLGYYS